MRTAVSSGFRTRLFPARPIGAAGIGTAWHGVLAFSLTVLTILAYVGWAWHLDARHWES